MNSNLTFTRIGYAYAPTTHIDSSIEWYTKHLQCKLVQKFEDRGSMIAVLHFPHLHSAALLLVETEDDRPLYLARNGRPFPILAFNCPDIEGTHRRLKLGGVEVEPLQSLGEGEAKYFYFRDDAGNYLEAAWSIWDPEDELCEQQ